MRRAIGDMRACIEDASPDVLHWRPGGDDTNPLSILVVHTLHSTRSWLSVAVGAPLPERDRPSEFVLSQTSSEALTSFVDAMARDCEALMTGASAADWAALRRTHPRASNDEAQEVTAAWALVHALAHLREHVGQMSLTRQLSPLA